MKKLILLELALLFLATTFRSDNPPGWYEQTLPVSDQINDIFFLDSLNGWVVTNGSFTGDTAYIMKTIDGGNNWIIQYRRAIQFSAIQFTDSNVGYAVGNFSAGGGNNILKTENGGNNWIELNVLSNVANINDLNFINKDTGWVCSIDPFDGGLFKTTNGGIMWQRQLNETYKPSRIFFINKDTGWIASNTSSNANNLLRTTNGGINWGVQFISAFEIESIFFLNQYKGWMRGGPDLNGNGASYTLDGGFSWISSTGNTAAGYDIKFINDSIGYSGMVSNRIPKSIDGGRTWGYQSSPVYNNLSISILKGDTLKVWAGGTGIVHTTDGGGTIVNIKNSFTKTPTTFILYQNYPNPFNPITKISYELQVESDIKLRVFDIQGKEISILVNEKQSSGDYEITFDGSNLNSGIFFYQLKVFDNKAGQTFSETKKMILIR